MCRKSTSLARGFENQTNWIDSLDVCFLTPIFSLHLPYKPNRHLSKWIYRRCSRQSESLQKPCLPPENTSLVNKTSMYCELQDADPRRELWELLHKCILLTYPDLLSTEYPEVVRDLQLRDNEEARSLLFLTWRAQANLHQAFETNEQCCSRKYCLE